MTLCPSTSSAPTKSPHLFRIARVSQAQCAVQGLCRIMFCARVEAEVTNHAGIAVKLPGEGPPVKPPRQGRSLARACPQLPPAAAGNTAGTWSGSGCAALHFSAAPALCQHRPARTTPGLRQHLVLSHQWTPLRIVCPSVDLAQLVLSWYEGDANGVFTTRNCPLDCHTCVRF